MDLQAAGLEELDDFESPDFAEVADADHSYLDSMWAQRKFRSNSQHGYVDPLVQDTLAAHAMVQAFVNAFARDGYYAVAFDSGTSTAGTDMKAKAVKITPAPIADQSITVEECGRILTGLAAHEVSHPRYGRGTWAGVTKAFPANPTADRLSNLLDDIRIERRFVGDYPGYAGIFEPTLDYIGKAQVLANGGKPLEPKLSSPVNLAIMATRYPGFAAWSPATEPERAWWTAWAARWSKEDAPARHVAAVREALAHVAKSKQAEPKPEEPSQGELTGAGDGTPDSSSSEAQGSSSGPSDKEINDATKGAVESDPIPTCAGSEAVDDAAQEGGVSSGDLKALKQEAQSIVDAERDVEDGPDGTRVDVAKSTRGLTHSPMAPKPSQLATRYVVNAILRSRTGHTAVDSFKRAGRLDQRDLGRVARGDARVFEKRTAPSPGRYLVWVMVDCSSSMNSNIKYAAQVAHALAAASVGTPTVRMAVWGWSDPFRRTGAYAGVCKVWESGMPADEVFKITGLTRRGTPDSAVVGWAAKAIKRAAKPSEVPVLIVASDGEGYGDLGRVVADAKKAGVVVKSVAFGQGLTKQEHDYGRGNFVPWAGSILKTAKPLADLVARVTSGR